VRELDDPPEPRDRVRRPGGGPKHELAGRPLTSHEVIVELIAATTTRPGLRVHAGLDRGSYPLGVKVGDRELAAVPLRRHDWHGEWNYTVLPTAA
jgi:Rhodopirellula transposase DDE domain